MLNIKNLQTIPSTGTKYAKVIKGCFEAPTGWLMIGVDFDSLEDKISALTTKDPNKLKVYVGGFDGHCLRAKSYFGDQMLDIDNTLEGINSIADKYPDLRQESKAPTFLLTYGGTNYGLHLNCGLPIQQAIEIETKYHELYEVADQWVADRLTEASKIGYVTCAFGLRLRTPMLKQSLLGTDYTPKEVAAESRTAGNALGQSYGLLNNRAAIEFQQRTLNGPHALDIKPIAHIHDAQYFIIKETPECVKWVNDNLIECVSWQELPELQHDIVKLSGTMSIFYPTWAKEHKVPNHASLSKIKTIMESLNG